MFCTCVCWHPLCQQLHWRKGILSCCKHINSKLFIVLSWTSTILTVWWIPIQTWFAAITAWPAHLSTSSSVLLVALFVNLWLPVHCFLLPVTSIQVISALDSSESSSSLFPTLSSETTSELSIKLKDIPLDANESVLELFRYSTSDSG